MPRRRLRAPRLWLVAVLLLTQLFGLVPAAAAQQVVQARTIATWNPKSLTAKDLAGTCPAADFPDAPCPITRGIVYETTVSFTVDQAVEPLILQPVGNGLEITAISTATGADFTRALSAGQVERVKLQVTVPEANSRTDRAFYIGKVQLVGGGTNVSGALPISVAIPRPRVTWGRLQVDDGSGDSAPLQAIVGSGETFARRVTLTSSVEVADFAVRSTSDRVTVTGAPDLLPANRTQTLLLTFDAPIVNKKTRIDVTLIPVSGVRPLNSSMRMRVVVLPATVAWGPPQLRATLNAEKQDYQTKELTITSNYDIPNVQFRTQDVGLTPILSPIEPVDMVAGRPVKVRVRLCPGYAPTTYFLGLTAYQGSKPLNSRLQIRMLVTGDAANIKPLPEGAADPCATGT